MTALPNPENSAIPASSIAYSSGRGASARLVGVDEDWFTYEFAGPTSSTNKFIRKYRRRSTLAVAQIPLLVGMVGMLPPEAFDALFDENTVELALNQDGGIFQEKLGDHGREICDMNDQLAWEFVRKAAGILNKVITEETPTLEGCLPLDESRITCIVPPVVPQPIFVIRKRAVRVFTLDDYVASGILSLHHRRAIRDAVAACRNIIILGGTGTGKTTFANAVLNEITEVEPWARLVVIEDTPELNATAPNKVVMQTTEHASMGHLVKTSLRLSPKRIIVGEVRDGNAWELLKIWNTGHPGGLATLHANDCASGIYRLKDLVSQHPTAPEQCEPNIALGVNLLVNIARDDTGRRIVAEVVQVGDFDPNQTENSGFRLTSL
ncbi:MAG: P-type conjugative transfer ATPase TrbB [Planctomycetota bacterium]|jgi:type IV secretion system protein VirB11|nr:P-type conjugative transfer ATPase TrbB [Planctomycetota bacterium]